MAALEYNVTAGTRNNGNLLGAAQRFVWFGYNVLYLVLVISSKSERIEKSSLLQVSQRNKNFAVVQPIAMQLKTLMLFKHLRP